jgi:transcriptional regulator with XRE-family HTH domain
MPEAPGTEAGAVTDEAVPELDAVVGANLKELRAKGGVSLDMLAGMSGVSRQVLGQIELGHAVASLGTLWRIASALEIPFSTLLARPTSSELRIFRTAGARRIASTDGRFTSRALFAPEDTGGAFEFYELWLAGHGRDDAEPHPRGTRENLVVTAGRLALEIADKRHELGKGDAIAFTADVPHSYINPASEECWMNLVMTYPLR